MDITRWDITVLLASSIAIMASSFVFPAAGLAGTANETAESDIPEFSVNSDRFDFADNFPRRPGAPSQSFLEYEDELAGASDNQVWMFGDTSNGLEFTLIHNISENAPHVSVNVWESGNIDQSQSETFVFRNESDVAHWDTDVSTGGDNYDWEVRFEAVEIELMNGGEDGSNALVSYTILQQPQDEAWYERIPLVGSVVSAGNDLVGMVGWIGAVIQWTAATIFEVVLNAIALMVETLLFFFTLASWFAGTYAAVVAGAPSGWAAAFLTLPGVLFAIEWGKLTVVAINVVWIG